MSRKNKRENTPAAQTPAVPAAVVEVQPVVTPETERLQAEYDALKAKCAAFDPETVKLLRARKEEEKRWLADRKADRAKLVAAKGAAFQVLQAARESAAKSADEAVAETAVV